MLRHLDRVVPAVGERSSQANTDHPMRRATRLIALEPGGWNPVRAAEVTALFDALAPEWHTRASESRLDVVADAFDRGGPIRPDTWLELGSGTGLASPWLASRCRRLLAVDLVASMLALAPPDVGVRVQADGADLPVPDRSIDVLVLINAFLFPGEARRIVSPGGSVVWVNTSGSGTPIHLPAEDVATALGPDWDGTASEAGHGTWAVFRRASGSVRAGRGPRATPAA